MLKDFNELWPNGVARPIIADSHSVDPGSNPGWVIYYLFNWYCKLFELYHHHWE